MKATINYTIKGVEFTIETWPDEITVEPMPKLILDYMLPKKVYGDDPMTQGIIEPVVPFMWGVRVDNSGYGFANNLAIDSAQPKIIESTAGANIDFKLLGTYINGERVENTLNINFGDIPPNSCATAGWKMMCSLTGDFSDYTATFKHSDALGGEATSLLEEIRTHVLVHEFMNDQPGKDSMFDFLIDDDDDGMPDMIIDSECDDQPVTSVSAAMVGTPAPENPAVQIIPDESVQGCVYISVGDPLGNERQLMRIVRSDGKMLNSHNFWLQENRIHLVDHDPTAAGYTVVYRYQSPVEIADVNAVNITSSSAVIEWTTSRSADSLVKYGPEPGNYALQKYDSENVTPHRIGLSGLNANMTYYYVISSTDPSENTNQSSEYNFTTLAAPDTTQPVIANVSATFIANDSATISWDTDELSDTLVKYGVEIGNYTMTMSNETDVTSHTIELTGLPSSTTYYYVVNSTDPSENTNESAEYSFTTIPTDTTPPIANAGPDQTVANGTYVIFNGSESYDHVGIVKYVWDFDELGGVGVDAIGVVSTYMYPRPGVYNATLTVYDAANNTDSDKAVIYVTGVTTSDVNVSVGTLFTDFEDDPANNSAYNTSAPDDVDINKAIGFEISANGTPNTTAVFIIVLSRPAMPEDTLYILKDEEWINVTDMHGASWCVDSNNTRVIRLVLRFQMEIL